MNESSLAIIAPTSGQARTAQRTIEGTAFSFAAPPLHPDPHQHPSGWRPTTALHDRRVRTSAIGVDNACSSHLAAGCYTTGAVHDGLYRGNNGTPAQQ